MHFHNCDKCGVQVSACEGNACQNPCADCGEHHEEGKEYDHKPNVHPNYGKAYCSLHHPDPAFHLDPTPPLKR